MEHMSAGEDTSAASSAVFREKRATRWGANCLESWLCWFRVCRKRKERKENKDRGKINQMYTPKKWAKRFMGEEQKRKKKTKKKIKRGKKEIRKGQLK